MRLGDREPVEDGVCAFLRQRVRGRAVAGIEPQERRGAEHGPGQIVLAREAPGPFWRVDVAEVVCHVDAAQHELPVREVGDAQGGTQGQAIEGSCLDLELEALDGRFGRVDEQLHAVDEQLCLCVLVVHVVAGGVDAQPVVEKLRLDAELIARELLGVVGDAAHHPTGNIARRGLCIDHHIGRDRIACDQRVVGLAVVGLVDTRRQCGTGGACRLLDDPVSTIVLGVTQAEREVELLGCVPGALRIDGERFVVGDALVHATAVGRLRDQHPADHRREHSQHVGCR